MSPDEKNQFADAAYEAVEHSTVQRAMEEYADNMRFELKGLPAYGLEKVARYAAIVARAQALGIDPDDLRLSPSEANSALLQRAAEMVYEGVPTVVVESCSDCGGSGKVRYHQGGPHGIDSGWMKCPTCKGRSTPT